jgi:cold shock CspA family protein
MGRAQESFNKKDVRSKKEKKRKEKEAKRLARKELEKSGKLEDMMAYVDEYGNISSTPPDPTKKKEEIKAENIEIRVPKQEKIDLTDTKRKGVVTFFNDAKGFGFIKDSETQESVFVHINNVIDEIKENNMVIFEVEMGPKGPTAVEVKVDK